MVKVILFSLLTIASGYLLAYFLHHCDMKAWHSFPTFIVLWFVTVSLTFRTIYIFVSEKMNANIKN